MSYVPDEMGPYREVSVADFKEIGANMHFADVANAFLVVLANLKTFCDFRGCCYLLKTRWH
jgi:hypothetical protein